MTERFTEPGAAGFFHTPVDGEDLLVRTKDPTDQATPAGNAVAADVLLRLGACTGREDYVTEAGQILRAFRPQMAEMSTATMTLLTAAGRYLRMRPQDKGPVNVEAVVPDAPLPAGGEVTVTVRVRITEGWHVMAGDGLSVSLEAAAPLALTEVRYPPPRQQQLGFSQEPVAVYEGVVEIRATLRTGAAASAGSARGKFIVRVQPCDDSRCLAPQRHEVPLHVMIASGD